MPVTDVTHDLDARTITVTAEFAAPVERIWQIYADPRQLEQACGPPTAPATFVQHELTPGGRSHYFMTSPDGVRHYGWWMITAVDEPRSFSFEDGFAADDSFAAVEDLLVSRNVYTFEAIDGGTRATFTSTYDSPEALRRMLEMGFVENSTAALDQIDALVAT